MQDRRFGRLGWPVGAIGYSGMLLAGALLLAACGGSPPAPTAVPTLPPPASATPARAQPPPPALGTGDPALSPRLAATWPPGTPLTADTVLAVFQGAGLPIDQVQRFPAQPAAPAPPGKLAGPLTKVLWHDGRLPPPGNPVLLEVRDGGAVEVYAEAATAQGHLEAIQTNAGLFSDLAETDFLHGPVLVRLAPALPPDAVAAYHTLMDALP